MSGPDAHAQERLRHLENEVSRLREQLRKKRDRKVFRQQIAFCTLLGLVWICTHILVQQQRLDRLFTSAQALLRPQAASPSASPVVELFSLARSVSDAGSNVLGMLSSAAGGAAEAVAPPTSVGHGSFLTPVLACLGIGGGAYFAVYCEDAKTPTRSDAEAAD
jgi:hypothetical protein